MIRLYANSANSGALLQAVLGGAVATTQPKATVSYIDMNPATTAQVQAQRGTTYQVALNSTTDVTIASPPGAAPNGTTGQSGYVRMIDYVGIYNEDTASVTVTVKIDDAGTERILIKATLATLESLYYEDGRGWYSTDANGAEKVTASAYVPQLSSFMAFLSADQTNVTGNGGLATAVCDSESYDVLGEYNPATGIFTALSTGKYSLTGSIRVIQIPAGCTSCFMQMITSNLTFIAGQENFVAGTWTTKQTNATFPTIMDAGDTYLMRMSFSGGAGDTADYDGAASPITYIGGYRIG